MGYHLRPALAGLRAVPTIAANEVIHHRRQSLFSILIHRISWASTIDFHLHRIR
jgi:hypothetical protein